ncbi:hypothetical protein ACFLU1_03940, partial [Chloroflexota bacterium]
DDDAILRSAAYNIPPGREGRILTIIVPTHADVLARAGWTKKDIAAFIAQFARTPLSHHPGYWGSIGSDKRRLFLKSQKDSPHESMYILDRPEWLKIIVAGGPGSFVTMLMGGQHGVDTFIGHECWVTKKIELPANWDALVKKYKDVVPTYVRY